MMIAGRPAKILLIDSNVYFSKRVGDALRSEGFEVVSANQAAFALTTLEYDMPAAVLCATNMREMGALEIAGIIHADPKNATLPVIAVGDGNQRGLMESFQAGCDDYIDRHRSPAAIAAHVKANYREQSRRISADADAGAVGHQFEREPGASRSSRRDADAGACATDGRSAHQRGRNRCAALFRRRRNHARGERQSFRRRSGDPHLEKRARRQRNLQICVRSNFLAAHGAANGH